MRCVVDTILENQVFFLSLASAIEFSKSIPEYKVCPLPANPFAKELFHKICVRLTPCVGFCEHKNLLGYFKAHSDFKATFADCRANNSILIDMMHQLQKIVTILLGLSIQHFNYIG